MSKYSNIRLDPKGTVYDTDPHDVDDSVWTDTLNMRFTDSTSEKIGGETIGTTITGDATHLLFNGDHTDPYWLYFGDGIARATNFVTDKDIEGAALSVGTNWNTCLFNLFPICNNTQDAPRYWDNDFATPGTLATLPAWPTNHLCQSIRPFRSFLVAMNITIPGTGTESNRVLWSDSSDTGALPASWDIADPTTLAGDSYLTDDRGEIIDGAALRDLFVIYKTHSIYIMRLVGGQSVMRFDKVQVNVGVLTKNCVVEFKGKHFIVTDGDVVLFDGQNIESIAEGSVRDKIFTDIDSDNYENSYVVRNDRHKEIWFCYPSTGQTWSDKCAIWNWKNNTWAFRSLYQTKHMAAGVTSFTSSPTWDSLTSQTWDSYKETWKAFSSNPAEDTIASASVGGLGAELVNDPGFDNPSDWTGTATITGSQAVFTGSQLLNEAVEEVAVIGSLYEITITADTISDVTTLNFGGVATAITSTRTFIIEAITTAGLFIVSRDSTFNDISVKTLPHTINIIDKSYDIVGAAMPSKLEKATMDLGTPDEIKIIKSVTPRITADAGTQIYIRLGSQFNPDDAIAWGSEVLYTVGQDREAHFTQKGRFISIRMRTQDTNVNWNCHGFYFKAATSGKH